MTGLAIFMTAALAGCAFLVYFMIALWRDSRKIQARTRVEIRKITTARADRGRVLHLYTPEQLDFKAKKSF